MLLPKANANEENIETVQSAGWWKDKWKGIGFKYETPEFF